MAENNNQNNNEINTMINANSCSDKELKTGPNYPRYCMVHCPKCGCVLALIYEDKTVKCTQCGNKRNLMDCEL